MNDDVDILMITHNRPAHTRLALTRLLGNIDTRTRVWLWQNGDDEETLEIVRAASCDSRVHAFHHSRENVKLRMPTNWLFSESSGAYLSKVDDDCLVSPGWLDALRSTHAAERCFGALGCWHFQDTDFDPKLAKKKIQEIKPGHRILRNPWIGGSGYLLKRACVEQAGAIRPDESFTHYCLRLALRGWINGWVFPFIYQEHIDDPRAPNTLIRTEDEFQRSRPLSAQSFGSPSLSDWDAQLRRSAQSIQSCPWDARSYTGWRGRLWNLRQQYRRRK